MNWELAWIIWGVLFAAGFVFLETWALVDRRDGDTLSENIRRWFGIAPARPVRRIAIPAFVGVLLVFVAWFVPHIVGQA